MSVRALLVYGYQPSGHSAAAFALEKAGRKAGLLFSRVEMSADHDARASLAVARGYHALLRAAPGVYGALYRGSWARSVLKAVRGAYLTLGGASRLRAGVRRSGAQVVVCPQAAVAAVLSEARRRGDLEVPVVSVLTDFGAHPFWAEPAADLVLAPSEAAVASLVALGAPRERLRVTGIPVDPAFASLPSRSEARRALALPASAPVVLLTGGGKGMGGLDRAAAALLSASPRAHLLVLCGANDRLRASLSGGGRVRAFGPQPPQLVAAMMAAADLHLGKPGGLSSAESLAAGLPMVLANPVPGQEEANARHLLAAGAAVAGGAREAAALLCDPERLKRMSAAATAAGRPDAASAAASEIASLVIDRPRSFLLQ